MTIVFNAPARRCRTAGSAAAKKAHRHALLESSANLVCTPTCTTSTRNEQSSLFVQTTLETLPGEIVIFTLQRRFERG